MPTYVVCGGRDYEDRARVYAALDGMQALGARIERVVTGGARGADTLAAAWAIERGVEVETMGADWAAHGRAAGPIRNAAILERWQPAAVIAFPGGRGTEDMVRKARGRGLPVYRAQAEDPPGVLRGELPAQASTLPLGSIAFGPPGLGQGIGAEVARVRIEGVTMAQAAENVAKATRSLAAEPLPPEAEVEAAAEWIDNAWAAAGERTLNLGCGRRPMLGAENHCLPPPPGVTMPYVNYVRDLDRMPWGLPYAAGHSYPRGDALPQGVWDVVVGLDLLEHIADVLGFLVEAALLLRPGGLLVLRYGASDNPASYTDPTHRHWLTDESLTFACRGTRLGDHYGAFYVDSLGRGVLRYTLEKVERSNPDPRWPDTGDWLALLRKLE